ncbi:MAG: FliM/FliN family flagellar motor switch protein [Phycisphaerales bacterium]
MDSKVQSILRIEVPLVVILGERNQDMQSVRQWVPGSIIELPINAEEDLQVCVNNRPIAKGSAVKLGENFGIRLTTTLGMIERIQALGAEEPAEEVEDFGIPGTTGMTPDEIAEAMLSGQI